MQTLPFSNLILIDRASAIPIFQQLSNGLMRLISGGKIKPGHRLPASREMASIMKLNRTTVIAAYDELKIQGWVEVVTKKGIFVSRQLPIIDPLSFTSHDQKIPRSPSQQSFYRQINFNRPPFRELKAYHMMINDGYPDSRIAPMHLISNRYQTLLTKTSFHSSLMTKSLAGSPYLRNELASFLSKTRALNIEAENVLVTHGAQLAIYIAANMILKAGSTVIVGDTNYILANKVFEQLGAKLVKVKVDNSGIDVDAIEEICSKSRPDLLYIIPHHHHPTTVTLAAERRVKLLDVIRRYQLPVIEDDYDYDFHYENSPILPLASSDHYGYVMYIGSISKTLAPTVRLGYLVSSEDFIWQASKLKQLVEIRGDVLFEESVAHLFNNGEMQRHLRRSVQLYKQRRDEFCRQLKMSLGDTAQFNTPQGGMAVWATFAEDYSISDLSDRLYSQGIYMNDGSIYRYSKDVNGIRLGFASLNTEEMMRFTKTLKQLK